jgi:hypothetical protein
VQYNNYGIESRRWQEHEVYMCNIINYAAHLQCPKPALQRNIDHVKDPINYDDPKLSQIYIICYIVYVASSICKIYISVVGLS